jgi:hypothetical protein
MNYKPDIASYFISRGLCGFCDCLKGICITFYLKSNCFFHKLKI